MSTEMHPQDERENQQILMTREEVAKLLRYKCTKSVHRLEMKGLLQAIRINSRPLYDKKEVQRLIQDCLDQTGSRAGDLNAHIEGQTNRR